MKNLILNLLVLAGVYSVFTLKAQKLPTEQTVTVALPSAFKIDGFANEWDNKFQARSKNTDVNYTLANNGQSLYLVVQATDPIIIKKIIGGGITFTINTSGQRADTAPFSLTFPVVEDKFQLSIFSTVNELTIESNQQLKDSLINAANKKIAPLTKTIKAKGFKTITDTLLSIYNDTGIKSAALINTSGALTCEFLVPINLLGITPNSGKPIAYNVMLNGTTSIKSVNFGGVIVSTIPRSLSIKPSDTSISQYPTDFWGSYLIK
ncbi:MAG TPA: hypothetical protein VGC01_12865 [Mucilaginibacter sp.]